MEKIKDIIIYVFNNEIFTLNNLKNYIDENYEKAVNCIFNCKGKIIFLEVDKSGLIEKKNNCYIYFHRTESCFLHPTEAFMEILRL